MEATTIFSFFVVLFLVVGMAWWVFYTDTRWTQSSLFLHYTDLDGYWIPRPRPSSWGTPWFTSDQETLLDERDHCLDVLEEELDLLPERDVAVASEPGAMTRYSFGSNAVIRTQGWWVSFRNGEQHRNDPPVFMQYVSELSIGMASSSSGKTTTTALAMMTFVMTHSNSPLCFCAERNQVSNVVPAITFQRQWWKSTSPFSDSLPERQERQRSIHRKRPLPLVSLWMQCMPHLTPDQASSLAVEFQVHRLGSSPASVASFASFVQDRVVNHPSVSLVVVTPDEQRQRELHTVLFYYELSSLSEGNVMAIAVFRSRATMMQLVALVFREKPGTITEEEEDNYRKGWIVLLLQEMARHASSELQEIIDQCWCADSTSEGLRFFQAHASSLLSLAFRTALMPTVSYPPSMTASMALFIGNSQVPLSLPGDIYTDCEW
jgi:hypothetical protein